MFDTLVTIVGNALTTPEWRRIQSTQGLVANFKVAANSRRYDKVTGRWVDGASLRVRVSCWRRLAENVTASVITGDPLIVTGRLYSRDWETEDGQRRVSYELDAVAVGHDLARGRGRFTRNRSAASTSVIDDDATQERVGGEATAPVSQLNDPIRQRVYDEDLGGYVTAVESDGAIQAPDEDDVVPDGRDSDEDAAERGVAALPRPAVFSGFAGGGGAEGEDPEGAALGGLGSGDSATGRPASGGSGSGGSGPDGRGTGEDDLPEAARRRRRGRVAVGV